MCFLDIFFHVRESESKLCYSLPAVLNTVLQYWGTCIFSNPSPDKLQNAWESQHLLPCLPHAHLCVGWAEPCLPSAPALPRGAGAALGARWSAVPPQTNLMLCCLSRLSHFPRSRQSSGIQGCLISCLSRLVFTWASVWEAPNTGLCVVNKHSYTRFCSFSEHFWGRESNAAPRENASSRAFLVHNVTKRSALTWIHLKCIFSSLRGKETQKVLLKMAFPALFRGSLPYSNC